MRSSSVRPRKSSPARSSSTYSTRVAQSSYVHGRKQRIRRGGKRIEVDANPEDVITIDVPEWQIIDDATWGAVQELFAMRPKDDPRERSRALQVRRLDRHREYEGQPADHARVCLHVASDARRYRLRQDRAAAHLRSGRRSRSGFTKTC